MEEFLKDLKEADDWYDNREDDISKSIDDFFNGTYRDVKFELWEAGNFDSPGYDASYYALAYIDSDGNLQTRSYVDESY